MTMFEHVRLVCVVFRGYKSENPVSPREFGTRSPPGTPPTISRCF